MSGLINFISDLDNSLSPKNADAQALEKYIEVEMEMEEE